MTSSIDGCLKGTLKFVVDEDRLRTDSCQWSPLKGLLKFESLSGCVALRYRSMISLSRLLDRFLAVGGRCNRMPSMMALAGRGLLKLDAW